MVRGFSFLFFFFFSRRRRVTRRALSIFVTLSFSCLSFSLLPFSLFHSSLSFLSLEKNGRSRTRKHVFRISESDGSKGNQRGPVVRNSFGAYRVSRRHGKRKRVGGRGETALIPAHSMKEKIPEYRSVPVARCGRRLSASAAHQPTHYPNYIIRHRRNKQINAPNDSVPPPPNPFFEDRDLFRPSLLPSSNLEKSIDSFHSKRMKNRREGGGDRELGGRSTDRGPSEERTTSGLPGFWSKWG